MMTARFIRNDGRQVHTAGPFTWVKATGGRLIGGPEGQEFAHYQGGVWAANSHSAPRCVVDGACCVARFVGGDGDEQATTSRFDTVEFVDGAIYAQPGRRLLAAFDERDGMWRSSEHQRSWPELVVGKTS